MAHRYGYQVSLGGTRVGPRRRRERSRDWLFARLTFDASRCFFQGIRKRKLSLWTFYLLRIGE